MELSASEMSLGHAHHGHEDGVTLDPASAAVPHPRKLAALVPTRSLDQECPVQLRRMEVELLID